MEEHDAAPAPAPASPKSWRVRHERHGGGVSFLSPAVRRVLAGSGLGARDLSGTGSGGRVTRADARAAVVAPMSVSDEIEPFSAIRRATATHVIRAKAVAPHAHVAVMCDYAGVDPVRRAHRLTYLPFVARSVIDALRAFPHCNATSADANFVVHREVHLGVAVDLAFEGLIVPVIRNAERLRLLALAESITDVAARARSRRLQPHEVVGGTLTITNPGPFGTFLSIPIINHPQVAILATDAVRRRIVVGQTFDGADALTIRPTGVLSLSFDHRVIDGAYASAFVARVAEILATRDWSSEV